VQRAEKAGGKVIVAQLDLAEPSPAEELLATAERQLGGLDILVNDAATHTSRPAVKSRRALRPAV
jgi:3-oxoacyl-[acyl-carrier protein] reductase